jgi:uncharacterized protein YjbI with pentapeptide repeats
MPVRVRVVDCGTKLMADPEHLALLRQGVEVWNAWRTKAASIVADLSGADLRQANLVRARLGGTDLNRAKLIGACLKLGM